MDQKAERKTAEDLVKEMEKMENVTQVSYLGDALFQISFQASGNVKTQPLFMGMKELPLFTFDASEDGTSATFRFLPDVDAEELTEMFPASGLSPKGTIVLTTELTAESSAGDPDKSLLANTYTWTVDGIHDEMPAMRLKLQ